MVFPNYGGATQGKQGHVQAGYQQIQRVQRHDRIWYAWKAFSQLLLIVSALIGAYVAYGYYEGWAIWEWAAAFWAVMVIRNLCEFMAGRWK